MSQFTPAGSGGIVTPVSIAGATTPLLTLVSMTTAGTEYSYSIPTNCKQFIIKLRDLASLQVAYISGQSGTSYIEISRGCFYAESDLNLSSAITIYFQSPSASQIAEILVWT